MVEHTDLNTTLPDNHLEQLLKRLSREGHVGEFVAYDDVTGKYVLGETNVEAHNNFTETFSGNEPTLLKVVEIISSKTVEIAREIDEPIQIPKKIRFGYMTVKILPEE